jgi:hypothetical protein
MYECMLAAKNEKTLIIIGAGSSKNIHESFPSGIELANLVDVHLITTKKRKDNYLLEAPYISPMINEALRIFGHEIEYLDSLIDELKIDLWGNTQEYYYNKIRTDAEPISIDNLISLKFKSYPDIINLAKQCIAYHLKGQESAYFDKINAIPNINSNWIEYLFYHLKSKGATFNDVKNNLQIISFNYERLFEYLSCKAIEKVFNEAIIELPFIKYIYGNIGNLKDISIQTPNDKTDKMRRCFLNIKLIGERHDIREKPNLDDFEKILFIGFGYDKENLSDTLSIQAVKSAKLSGMCRKKTKMYEDVERDFKINITAFGDHIEDFIRANL